MNVLTSQLDAAHAHKCMQAHARCILVHTLMHTLTHTLMHARRCMHTLMHTQMRARTLTHLRARTRIHTHADVDSHVHAHGDGMPMPMHTSYACFAHRHVQVHRYRCLLSGAQ